MVVATWAGRAAIKDGAAAEATLLVGDARTTLPELPDASVSCCITSPPSFGLRRYGGSRAELGAEAALDDYVENLAGVCAELRRVLHRSGVLWLSGCGAPYERLVE